jgi:hypothetical protein
MAGFCDNRSCLSSVKSPRSLGTRAEIIFTDFWLLFNDASYRALRSP